jgi:tetratricopeptide (TPR) repeat protein
LVIAFSWVTGCGKREVKPENVRLVVERFENQSAKRSLDKISSSAAESLVWALAADPVVAASAALDSEQARASRAGVRLSGQIREGRPGQIELIAQLVDSSSSALLHEISLAASEDQFVTRSCAALLEAVRKQILGSAGGCFGSDAEWIGLAEEGGPAKLIANNPKFWPAYLSEAQGLLRAGKRIEAKQLFQSMGMPADRPGQFARGQLTTLLAENVKERLAGFDATLAVRPVDLRMREEAAALAQSAGQWDDAARHLRELLKADPKRADLWNSLGYAEANRGKTDEAVAAILEYRKLAPNEENPWDSLGEVQYMGRRFREAAQAFDELNRRFPAFQNRNGFWKSAVAWSMAGDLKEADRRHALWLEPLLGRITPSTLALQKAYWLARTGRAGELSGFWEKEISGSSGERKMAAELHRAMLEFGMTLQAPERSQFVQWSKELKDPGLRQEFAFFGLLSDNAGSPKAWQERIAQAVGPAQMNGIGAQLVATGMAIWSPLPTEKSKVEALPENPPGPLEVLLLRRRIAVLR